jgi:hypothetical protein
MRYVLLIIIALLTINPISINAQDQEIQADGWRGLTLDVSTLEDAVRILGKPSRDEEKVSVRIWGIDNWLVGKEKQKIFRTLKYKWEKVKGVEFVELAFLDGKLVVVTLEGLPTPDRRQAGWIDPDKLEEIFSVLFKPRKREASKNLPSLSEFQASAPTELIKYENYYDLLGVADKSFIVALVDNEKDISGFVGIFGADPTARSREKEKKKIRKAIDQGGKYPGYINALKIISRRLAAQ